MEILRNVTPSFKTNILTWAVRGVDHTLCGNRLFSLFCPWRAIRLKAVFLQVRRRASSRRREGYKRVRTFPSEKQPGGRTPLARESLAQRGHREPGSLPTAPRQPQKGAVLGPTLLCEEMAAASPGTQRREAGRPFSWGKKVPPEGP